VNLTSAETLPTESPPPDPNREQPHTCEECGSPLDIQQRYCVRCGTRNRNAASPAANYFSRPSRRAKAVPAATSRPRRGWIATNAPALLLAVLPVAVAVGVLIGKNGSGNDQQLIDALKSQRPAASAVAPAAAAATSASKPGASSKARSARHGKGGKTLAKTKFGSAHQVSGAKPSAQKVQSDTNLVKKLQTQTGKSYLQQQTQGLPDEVVVGK
jgi:hypothetical protein